MALVVTQLIPSPTYTSELFTLSVMQRKTKTYIHMQMANDVVNTRDLSNTYQILETMLPQVLLSQCFNEENLPFSMEVRQTEIGHLFEHILLEYLCLLKLEKGCKRHATYQGVTQWNWRVDPWGTFHIHISTGTHDIPIFAEALEKTIHLVSLILQYGNAKEPTLNRIPEAVIQ
jgi:hypothetical protein